MFDSQLKKYFTVFSAALLQVSCALSPHDQANTSIDERIAIPERWQQRHWQHQGFTSPAVLQPEPIRRSLLTLFAVPSLEKVVKQALAYNIDIATAALRMEEAGLTVKSTQAEQLPRVNGTLGRTRSRSADSVYNAGLDVSWELDLWGRLRQQTRAQKAVAQARRDDYQQTRDSIAAQTMQLWFNIVVAQQQLQLQQARVASLEATQASIQQRYLSGLKTITDLDSARTRLAQSRAARFQTQSNVESLKRRLQILLGEYPDAAMMVGHTLPSNLPALDAGVPAEVLSRRPDLRAAWQAVLEADANTRVSYSAMFPRISLTGSLGHQSQDFSQLMSSSSSWNIATNLAAPLFNAGRLRNQYQTTQKRAVRAYLNYQKVSLSAFLEVENALFQEGSLQQQEIALQQAFEHAKYAYQGAEQDYRDGVIDVLGLLSAQQSMFDIESSLIALRNARIQNRITLGLALGVGV